MGEAAVVRQLMAAELVAGARFGPAHTLDGSRRPDDGASRAERVPVHRGLGRRVAILCSGLSDRRRAGLLPSALAAEQQPMAEETARQRAQSYRITDREHAVLVLVAQGMTNKEIGAKLAITEDTVKKHVQNLIWKLRAADRTQAAITAPRLGMLDTPE